MDALLWLSLAALLIALAIDFYDTYVNKHRDIY